MSAAITGIGSAFPASLDQQDAWEDFFSAHYDHSPVARRLWRQVGVDNRHAVVNPRHEDLSQASTALRMARFVDEVLPLGKAAINAALAAAAITSDDVDVFTVVSCTGYATPGIDVLLARDLAMPASTQRLHVGHMGCYAALPALAAVSDAAVARGKTGLVLCAELTSLHLQPGAPDDLEQVVAHALFSDAVVAAVVEPGRPGLELVDFHAATDAASAEEMTWQVTDRGFRMGLSPRVPAILDAHVLPVTEQLLHRNGLALGDVDHWAVHPGGPRIISTVARRLGLSDADVAVSREVLRVHGNCSSATILLVLDELAQRRSPKPGEHVVAMAFGPGLTLYLALLRAR